MSRVDFYILNSDDEAQRLHFLCRLTEKAYRLGHQVWIHAPAAQHAETLDERLWTFSQGSFVPHDRATSAEADCPVIIGDGEPPPDARPLLINEAETIPDFADRFERIAEVVNQAESVRIAGRRRYTHYRDQGHDLHHHRLD